MGVTVWLLTRVLPLHRAVTIVEVAAGVAVYILAAFALKVLSVDDIKAMLRKRGKNS